MGMPALNPPLHTGMSLEYRDGSRPVRYIIVLPTGIKSYFEMQWEAKFLTTYLQKKPDGN